MVQAQDAIISFAVKLVFATLRLNGWSILTRSPICGREECSHLPICEVGLGLGWGALPLDPQRRIEAGLCLWLPTDG